MPAIPSEIAPSGQGRLLAHALGEIRIRAAHPLGEAPRDLLDLAREPGVDGESSFRHAGDELDRPVVVRRPEAAGDEADVCLERARQRGLELVGVVADDRDLRGLQAQQERLTGIERSVQVCSLPAHQLAAGHDDGGPGAAQERGEIVRRPLFGTSTRTPATRTTTFPGEATDTESFRDANLLVWPRSSVPR